MYKTDVLVEPKAMVPDVARLPGIDGQAKMGKSLNNAIYLSDTTDELAKKVKSMYTDPTHLRVEDPGKVEGNPVFIYLEAFDPDKKGLEEMKAHYQRGGLGDSIVKKRLLEVLESFLTPIREKRDFYKKDLPAVWKMLFEGTKEAESFAAQTLKEVRQAMHIDY
jgi:tryptophanyl-tRNA synthetase